MNKFKERFYERYKRENRVRRTPRTYRKKEKEFAMAKETP
jgi:hypothetical protein